MRYALALSAFALGTLAFASPAVSIEPPSNCAAMQTWLQMQPNVQSATTTLTIVGSPRCEANFIYSSRGGMDAGYAPGQDQRIVLRVGLPLNSLDGGTGGVQGAWNGKVMNLGGGGLVGNVGNVTSATDLGYVGSSTDSGHPASDNPNFAVIQATHELNYGRLDDFLIESIHQQYKWALKLAEVYYGQPASRNYWNGCSTGGRQGLSLAINYGNDFDGFLVGAPANYNSRLQVATLWPWWVNEAITGSTLTNTQATAANASAVAACDTMDGVADGILADPRKCKFDAQANICGQAGAPAAPDCLTSQQAHAMNMIWDGPRNDRGTRIWFAFGRGANAFVTQLFPPFGSNCGNLGSQCWAHRDINFDWHGRPLSQFDDETQLATNVVAPYSDIISVVLDKAKNAGAKIVMWHGGADPLIPWQQSAHYYTDAISYYGGIAKPERGLANLMPWFRFFLAPGVGHCGNNFGTSAPVPDDPFGALVNWVENGVAPDSLLASNGGVSRPLCPWPQTAIYDSGDPNLASSFHCGGNLETNETLCDSLITKYQKETQKPTETVGYRNPGICKK